MVRAQPSCSHTVMTRPGYGYMVKAQPGYERPVLAVGTVMTSPSYEHTVWAQPGCLQPHVHPEPCCAVGALAATWLVAPQLGDARCKCR